MKVKRNLIVFFAFCVLCVSCSPIARHSRLVEKYPFVHEHDTIIITDTIRLEIPKIQVDTVFKTSQLHDTIVIEKERLKITMYTVHDSIYVDAKCDTVTIEKIVVQKIPIRYYEKTKSWIDQVKGFLKWFLIIVLIIASLLLIYKITKK